MQDYLLTECNGQPSTEPKLSFDGSKKFMTQRMYTSLTNRVQQLGDSDIIHHSPSTSPHRYQASSIIKQIWHHHRIIYSYCTQLTPNAAAQFALDDSTKRLKYLLHCFREFTQYTPWLHTWVEHTAELAEFHTTLSAHSCIRIESANHVFRNRLHSAFGANAKALAYAHDTYIIEGNIHAAGYDETLDWVDEEE